MGSFPAHLAAFQDRTDDHYEVKCTSVGTAFPMLTEKHLNNMYSTLLNRVAIKNEKSAITHPGICI